jgi:hypothetical protein
MTSSSASRTASQQQSTALRIVIQSARVADGFSVELSKLLYGTLLVNLVSFFHPRFSSEKAFAGAFHGSRRESRVSTKKRASSGR